MLGRLLPVLILLLVSVSARTRKMGGCEACERAGVKTAAAAAGVWLSSLGAPAAFCDAVVTRSGFGQHEDGGLCATAALAPPLPKAACGAPASARNPRSASSAAAFALHRRRPVAKQRTAVDTRPLLPLTSRRPLAHLLVQTHGGSTARKREREREREREGAEVHCEVRVLRVARASVSSGRCLVCCGDSRGCWIGLFVD